MNPVTPPWELPGGIFTKLPYDVGYGTVVPLYQVDPKNSNWFIEHRLTIETMGNQKIILDPILGILVDGLPFTGDYVPPFYIKDETIEFTGGAATPGVPNPSSPAPIITTTGFGFDNGITLNALEFQELKQLAEKRRAAGSSFDPLLDGFVVNRNGVNTYSTLTLEDLKAMVNTGGTPAVLPFYLKNDNINFTINGGADLITINGNEVSFNGTQALGLQEFQEIKKLTAKTLLPKADFDSGMDHIVFNRNGTNDYFKMDFLDFNDLIIQNSRYYNYSSEIFMNATHPNSKTVTEGFPPSNYLLIMNEQAFIMENPDGKTRVEIAPFGKVSVENTSGEVLINFGQKGEIEYPFMQKGNSYVSLNTVGLSILAEPVQDFLEKPRVDINVNSAKFLSSGKVDKEFVQGEYSAGRTKFEYSESEGTVKYFCELTGKKLEMSDRFGPEGNFSKFSRKVLIEPNHIMVGQTGEDNYLPGPSFRDIILRESEIIGRKYTNAAAGHPDDPAMYKEFNLTPDSIYFTEKTDLTDISYGKKGIRSFYTGLTPDYGLNITVPALKEIEQMPIRDLQGEDFDGLKILVKSGTKLGNIPVGNLDRASLPKIYSNVGVSRKPFFTTGAGDLMLLKIVIPKRDISISCLKEDLYVCFNDSGDQIYDEDEAGTKTIFSPGDIYRMGFLVPAEPDEYPLYDVTLSNSNVIHNLNIICLEPQNVVVSGVNYKAIIAAITNYGTEIYPCVGYRPVVTFRYLGMEE